PGRGGEALQLGDGDERLHRGEAVHSGPRFCFGNSTLLSTLIVVRPPRAHIALMTFPSDIAFSPAVKEQQRARGSRTAYARMEAGPGWRTAIDAELAAFIAEQTS